jgi:hypothetical protein
VWKQPEKDTGHIFPSFFVFKLTPTSFYTHITGFRYWRRCKWTMDMDLASKKWQCTENVQVIKAYLLAQENITFFKIPHIWDSAGLRFFTQLSSLQSSSQVELSLVFAYTGICIYWNYTHIFRCCFSRGVIMRGKRNIKKVTLLITKTLSCLLKVLLFVQDSVFLFNQSCFPWATL